MPSTEPFPQDLWGRRICALISCYDGPAGEAEASMRPIRAELPPPILDGVMHLYPIDGAVHRVGPDDTAWNFRDATWSMVIAGIDPDPTAADTPHQLGATGWTCTPTPWAARMRTS